MLLIMFYLFLGMLAVFFDNTESDTESETKQCHHEVSTSEFDAEFKRRAQKIRAEIAELENEICTFESKIKESEDKQMVVVSHMSITKHAPMGVCRTENHSIELSEEEKERRRKQQERLDSEAWQEDMYYDAQNGEAEE